MLERLALKGARAVLRRGGSGNASSLSDSVGLQTPVMGGAWGRGAADLGYPN